MGTFRRKIYDTMLQWKRTYDGRRALLIEGARRIGKTTIVEEFARNEYESYLLINFSEAEDRIKDLFKEFSRDLDSLFRNLQFEYNVVLKDRKSVIIFDEVQAFPRAREMIKHLVADGRYDYIETCSLISLRRNVKDIVIPSEETRVCMHPMDFEEFLWAQGDEVTMSIIKDSFESQSPLGFTMHKGIMRKYTTYMLIGGMPQAVDALIRTNNFSEVETEKRDILSLYLDDTQKMDNGTIAERVLSKIPALLSKHDRSFSPGMVKRDSRMRDYLDAVEELSRSRMVNVCYRSSDPNPALNLFLDELDFKLYMADTGLLFTRMIGSNVASRDEIYRDMLDGRMNINGGMFFENMVAQELVCTGHELIFSKFKTNESERYQEVDFLISDGSKVTPVEVKSSISTRHVSLDRFMAKYSDHTDRAYVIHGKDLRKDDNIVYLPIYMTMFI